MFLTTTGRGCRLWDYIGVDHGGIVAVVGHFERGRVGIVGVDIDGRR